MLKSILTTTSFVTSNNPAQRALTAAARGIAYLRGMGSGAGVTCSGETRVLSLLDVGSTVFDVGANKGDFAACVLKADRCAKLHCFEPSRYTFSQLQNALKGHSARLNNCALSESCGEATLYTNEKASGLASLTKRNLVHFGKRMDIEESVQVTTLDAYCEHNGIEHIDLLKVDVEGNELKVFRGASHMISRRKIHFILFEFGGANIDTRTYFQDFFYLFTGAGASNIYRITPSGGRIKIDQYSEDLEYFLTTNYMVEF